IALVPNSRLPDFRRYAAHDIWVLETRCTTATPPPRCGYPGMLAFSPRQRLWRKPSIVRSGHALETRRRLCTAHTEIKPMSYRRASRPCPRRRRALSLPFSFLTLVKLTPVTNAARTYLSLDKIAPFRRAPASRP